MRDAGISYAVDQIIDLVANGVNGVHIYTMNDPYVAKRISDSVANIIKK
jgi:methylenetetrahydrofolate reductase (NADPH)